MLDPWVRGGTHGKSIDDGDAGDEPGVAGLDPR